VYPQQGAISLGDYGDVQILMFALVARASLVSGCVAYLAVLGTLWSPFRAGEALWAWCLVVLMIALVSIPISFGTTLAYLCLGLNEARKINWRLVLFGCCPLIVHALCWVVRDHFI